MTINRVDKFVQVQSDNNRMIKNLILAIQSDRKKGKRTRSGVQIDVEKQFHRMIQCKLMPFYVVIRMSTING